MPEPVFIPVIAIEDVPEKEITSHEINGMDIVLCRFRGEVFALENRCSHAASSFDGGRLRAYTLICPMHGATFDIRDGSCTGFPARVPVKAFPCRVNKGMIEVAVDSPTGTCA